jgi:hypothetical protein
VRQQEEVVAGEEEIKNLGRDATPDYSLPGITASLSSNKSQHWLND